MQIGWDASAPGWLDHMGEAGDFGRQYVLDAPMLDRVRRLAPQTALDVGCGEGRFCRAMQALGAETTGIDPTRALLAAAKERDSNGCYIEGLAEKLPFAAAEFDLVVSYLSLIDIPDMDAAISEMVRVLRPGGHVLIANLQSYVTAWDEPTMEKLPGGLRRCTMVDYLQDHGSDTAWADIRIMNYHRPLARYMQAFLSRGLHLTHFAEPAATGGPDDRRTRYNHAPWFLMMEWQKPL